MQVVSTRVRYRIVGRGVAHCERCGGDRAYWQRTGRRWVHVLGMPVFAAGATGDHLRCTACQTCYRVDLLAVPTVYQMRSALAAGTTAAVLAILRAGEAASPPSPAVRSRAIETIRSAGRAEYGPEDLDRALAGPGDTASGLRRAVEELAVQLEEHAREWFLTGVVQVGLAGGSLSERERAVIGSIGRSLGMSQARARNVICLAEEAAQAG